MMKFTQILLLSILIFFIGMGCKHEPSRFVRDVCFESEVLPIFIANCSQAGCHGNGSHAEGYTLDNYNGIMKGIKPFNSGGSKHIKQIESREMPVPPNLPLSAEQIQVIKDWIDGGAINSTNCDTSSVCDTTTVTYSNQVSSIMTQYCVGCHSGNPPQGNIDLTTYANVKNQINLGRFWGSVNFDSGFSPMPKGGQQLNSCNLATLKIWLDNGAPNN